MHQGPSWEAKMYILSVSEVKCLLKRNVGNKCRVSDWQLSSLYDSNFNILTNFYDYITTCTFLPCHVLKMFVNQRMDYPGQMCCSIE